MTTLRTTSLAEHWLGQSEMWLAELPHGMATPAAITDLRQNARAAVHDAITQTEAAAVAAAVAEYRLRHPSEGDDERLGRAAAVRGMMVRLGLYGAFEAALDRAPTKEAPRGE